MKKSTTNLSFAIGGVLAGVIVATVAMTLVFGPEIFSLRSTSQAPDVTVQKNPASIPTQGMSESSGTEARSLQQILEITDEFVRKGAFYSYLSELDEDKALELVKEIDKLVDSLDREFLLHGAFTRLASMNFELVLEELQGLSESERSFVIAMLHTKHVQSDPEFAEALIELLSQESKGVSHQVILSSGEDLTEEQLEQLLQSVPTGLPFSQETWEKIVRLKAMDPEKAWNEIADSISDNDESFTVAINIARPWVKRDGLEALGKIATSVSRESDRRKLITNLAEEAFVHDPEGVLTFLQDYPDRYENPFNATNRVLRKWTASDPLAALAAATKLDNETSSTTLREKTLKAWGEHEPETVWEHLSNQPRNLRDQIRSTLLFHMTRESPHKAMALVDTIENDQEREHITHIAHIHWAHNSPRSALEWTFSQPEQKQSRSIASRAIGHLAEEDPKAAMEYSLSASTPFRDELQLLTVQTIARSDAELALEFLPLLSRDNQVQAVSSIGSSILSFDPSRAILLGRDLERGEQSHYYQNLVRSVDADNLHDFVEVIKELPSQELVSRASYTLLTRYSHNNSLGSTEKTYLQDLLLPVEKQQLEQYDRRYRR